MKRLRLLNRKWVFVLTSLTVLSVATLAFADGNGPFSLFGNARKLPYGLAPDGSVELISDCNPVTPAPAPFACDFGTLTFSGISFTPNSHQPLTLDDITTLSADYNVGASDCGGGSPRFSISLNTGKNVFVYIGPEPNTIGCFYGWQSTGNVVQVTDLRWDTSQIGGTFYDTHADALTLAGGTPVTHVSIVLDGGWTAQRGQDALIDNFTVNNHVMRSGHNED